MKRKDGVKLQTIVRTILIILEYYAGDFAGLAPMKNMIDDVRVQLDLFSDLLKDLLDLDERRDEYIRTTDWKLLQKQKDTLYNVYYNLDKRDKEIGKKAVGNIIDDIQDLLGIVHILDAFQEIHKPGYPGRTTPDPNQEAQNPDIPIEELAVKELIENPDYRENLEEIVNTFFTEHLDAHKEWCDWFKKEKKLDNER